VDSLLEKWLAAPFWHVLTDATRGERSAGWCVRRALTHQPPKRTTDHWAALLSRRGAAGSATGIRGGV